MNLNINTAGIRLTINEDPNRVIEFDPDDVAFVEAFHGLISEFEGKETEYRRRSEEIEKNNEVDEYGIPKNAKEVIALMREVCEYFRSKIDEVFGEGTSNTVFGKANRLEMFAEFFEGITPFIQKARTGKIEKYTGNRGQRRAMK